MDQLTALAECSASPVPGWLLAGTYVPGTDLITVNEDAATILEPEEFDWSWLLVDVQLDLIPLHPTCENLPDQGRMASLARLPAGARPPVILSLNLTSQVVLLDGYHRCTLASQEGRPAIRALVGIDPNRS